MTKKTQKVSRDQLVVFFSSMACFLLGLLVIDTRPMYGDLRYELYQIGRMRLDLEVEFHRVVCGDSNYSSLVHVINRHIAAFWL